jgi:DNA-binding response OmpR family regulator
MMGGKKILIVDDDRLVAKTIDMCLSKRGYQVKVLHNGAAAVKYLFEEKPDLMILDIRLPDCDGWFIMELLGKLEAAQKVRVIVISALEPDQRKVSEAKPYAYLQKPFDMGELIQIAEKSLKSSNSTNHTVIDPSVGQ